MSGNAMQMALRLQLPDRARFDNFYPGPNAELVRLLRDFVLGREAGSFHLWGRVGEGRSHLLMAACRAVSEQGGQSLYLSLTDAALPPPAELAEAMAAMDLVALDDLQGVAGRAEWEEMLFSVYNRLRDSGRRLLTAAHARPEHCGFHLPDLVSRLNWGLVYGLKGLTDTDREQLLKLRAGQRGLDMPDEVARYLLKHYPRDLATLCQLLDTLDTASLVEQRRLTVPFIKQVLARR